MKESEIQQDIMKLLASHPKVAWAYVTSTGTFRGMKGGRPITIGFPGMADIIGQLRDGRLLAIEVKKPSNYPTKEQKKFLDDVNKNKGVAFMADSIDSVMYQLS